MSGGKGKWALLGGRRTVVGGVVAHGILGRCGGSGGGGTHIAGVCGRGEMLPGILQKGAGSHNRRQLSHLLSLLFDPLVLSTTHCYCCCCYNPTSDVDLFHICHFFFMLLDLLSCCVPRRRPSPHAFIN